MGARAEASMIPRAWSRAHLVAAATFTVAFAIGCEARPLKRTARPACSRCHDYPPATGAHAAHAGFASAAASGPYGDTSILEDLFPAATPASAPQAYFFGCGNCHPLDPAKHMDGRVEVELWDPAAPAGSLKARASPQAIYSGGACSGVYCHSGGQQNPVYVTTPTWTGGAQLGCTGCHDNPPRYPSGGAGAPTANTHLILAGDGYEAGHFGGFPSAWHGSNHGSRLAGEGAAPITCQTCHFETVDPANTGPSGFYYLDTSGNYQLPGGLLRFDCASCHGGAQGAPPQGTGRVLPLRHVNGVRDVAFDARTAMPPYVGLPPAPNTPTRPYWEAPGSLGPPLPSGMAYDGTTLSANLGAATYAPATKTCSNVACHLQQSSVQWGGPEDFTTAQCNGCHGF